MCATIVRYCPTCLKLLSCTFGGVITLCSYCRKEACVANATDIYIAVNLHICEVRNEKAKMDSSKDNLYQDGGV